jgi:predicted outer membrane protein
MKEAEKLGKKMGNDFDREYLSKMVKGHEKVTSMVTGKMKDVSPELQTALTDMLPTLRKHEMEAKQMLDQVKGSHEAQGRRSSEYDHQQR